MSLVGKNKKIFGYNNRDMGIINYVVGNNKIMQMLANPEAELLETSDILPSWKNAFSFFRPEEDSSGLRPAQLGALFSIKAHWIVSNEPATIVMPTGTGKTETMIATVVSEMIDRTLIIVPSNLLRKQTAEKFLTFGILQNIGVISHNAIPPTVTALLKTPKEISDLKEIFEKSNVVVTTMSLLQRFSDEYLTAISEGCNTLIVDEAHHIAANTWSTVKYKLRKLRCLQFTATPFRNDGKKVDGKIIYNFPLAMAQQQGYFQEINFLPILEFDEEKGDISIATAAVEQLENDLKAGYNHIILVRAKDKRSADRLYNLIYLPNFADFNPVLVHSDISVTDRNIALRALREGTSRIVVCVDMFGEGIDIPSLKIAAVHDKYKSLPITLQFIGRFARSSEGLGAATVITNIANDELNESLQELYAQDSDWNVLLHVLANREIDKELSLQELAQGFDSASLHGMTIQQLRPKVSMIAYSTNEKKWNPHAIYDVFAPDNCFFTINEDNGVIVIVEKLDSNIDWTSFKGINDTNWQLHLIYWNPDIQMFFVNSTNKGISDTIAAALFAQSTKISGEKVFRCLHGIKRLMLGTIGLKSAIDGPIRFRMFAGVDIGNGIAESQKETSFKSNLFGAGYSGTGKVSIGCSYKGRIWSRWVESIDYWMKWCNEIASRLKNEAINTSKIFEGALVPEIVNARPSSVPYGIEWPIDLDLLNDNSIIVSHGPNDYTIYELDIKLTDHNETGPLRFSVGNGAVSEKYELHISEGGYEFKTIKASGLILKRRKREYKLTEFFNEFPPRIKFVDQSMLEGNILVKMTSTSPAFNLDRISKWDWSTINIRKESQGVQRDRQSIQYHVIQNLIATDKYCVIFDDDDAGEIADIVSVIDETDKITIQLYHCKYAHGDNPGARVVDLYEVCGQAEKSVKWCQEPLAIIDRLIKRESSRAQSGGTRFEVGNLRKLREIKNKMRVFPTKIEISIIQPGIDSSAITDDMLRILSGTASYLLDTYSIDLKVICS
ncbi:DEAD/DEAH box helicase family protein [Christensenellaceae bacterium OttesenSCG-928-K19]|nr:DEAD/DEAH box helicase family protein [Christensenellaceae bacterium OttesenSCG-928-K19]